MEERPFSDISYKRFLNEEKLMGSRCKECGEMSVPPRQFCVKCHSDNMEWQQLSGEGELAAFTCIFVAPPSMAEMGYGRKNPYCTGVVQLEEGPRTVARIEGVDASKPESIKVGFPLKVDFLHAGEGDEMVTSLAFRHSGG
jgi:uncharacterized OB-fold protein